MARLFTVVISEANSNPTKEQIWMLNNISSRISSLGEVSHSVRNDTYSGYSEMIELLVQVLDASTDTVKGYLPRYQEVRQALTTLLAKYESHQPQEKVEEAHKSYENKYDDFAMELEEIEQKVNPDGDLDDRRAFHFFHEYGKRESIQRRKRLRQIRDKKDGLGQ